jgi:hypothetical protein
MSDLIKTMYLIRGTGEETHKNFRNRILTLLGGLSGRKDIETISVVLTSETPPGFSVIPFRKDKIASISVKSRHWLDMGILEAENGFAGSYEVTEAIPVGYRKTWRDGDPTPGVNLLTLFSKKKSIEYDTFIHRWHLGHTPLSLKIHPLWNYNRNVIDETLNGSSESWDGIVEEHFKSKKDLLNPARFFGGPISMLYRMLQVYLDTRSFLDYDTIQTYLGLEYHIKSIGSS